MFNSFFISQKMDMPLPPERLAVWMIYSHKWEFWSIISMDKK